MSLASDNLLRRARFRLWEAYGRYVALVCAHPGVACLFLAVGCLPALALSIAFFSHIEAGLQELLPPSAPSVRALNRLHAAVGGKSHLAVIAHSGDRAANEGFISQLTERMARAKLPEVRSIEGNVRVERAWLMRRAPLLIPQPDFERLVSRFDQTVRAEKQRRNPLQLELGEDEPPASANWKELETEFDRVVGKEDRFPSGYLETPDGKLVVAIFWLEGSEVDLGPSQRLMAGVQREIAGLRPEFPGVAVAFNGEVPNLLEEHDAILSDLSVSSLFVVVLVGACISLYFRSLHAVLTVVLALLPGLLFSFALGRLTIGGLNSNTAFLGTIIAGNGINYPLLFLAYYRAEPAELSMPQALRVAARQALPGTLAAALAASAAYGGLAASDFRGFSQFGILGGLGMATVWVFTYLAMPLFVALLRPPRRNAPSTAVQQLLHLFFARGWLSSGLAVTFAATLLVWTGLGVAHALSQGIYERDLRVLRNQESLKVGGASWDAKMNEVFGVWLNPVVAFTEDSAHREPAAATLRGVFAEKDPGAIQGVDTIEKFVPPLSTQQARLRELSRIGARIRRLPDSDIPERMRADVRSWFSEESLQPIELPEVPDRLTSAFRELSGRVDRVALVYPSIHVDYDDGRNLSRFAEVVRSAQLPPDVSVGGGFLFMADILQLVRDEAPQVVLVVAAMVCVLLLAIFARRPGRALVSLVTMLAAAFCSQAIVLALGIKINLLNFAALPITIGVGADYVVNLLGAMTSLRVDARGACVRMGGAILLCSLTTVIGYLSLVLAKSGALRSFGWAAVIGELVASLTVLLVLPVALGTRLADAVLPPGSLPPSAREPST